MKQILACRWMLAVVVGLLGIVVQSANALPNATSAKIDRLVISKLNELGIPPSDICTDEVFIRRVYLDMTGTLPSSAAVKHFLSSKGTRKRDALIEELFEHPEFDLSIRYPEVRQCL